MTQSTPTNTSFNQWLSSMSQWLSSTTKMTNLFDAIPASPIATLQQAMDYTVDAWQRSVLLIDLLRHRGNEHLQHEASSAPNVLDFDYELVLDGRTFERPVNYCLLRITTATPQDTTKRPFIVFDPRAGHGPGIGGMKHDSEIGVALEAGHPCYFVGFLPNPMPGQTIEDVCLAEAQFVEKVAELHPEAVGKPCLIGNCQAGWQIMMMSAVRPDVVGPIVLAGAPLSYWAGVHGKNPLRYLGGLLGGSWMASLAGDLGNGIFDGAALVANFENMNPANTYWKKNYHVYSNVDTEGPRFLEFEKWWGSPVLLNAKEMQFIVDELFVGNKLTSGEIAFSDGMRVDIRNVKSPIIVFCSWGDDITPPQQALQWILDIHKSDEDLIASGQTIVYSMHQSTGHLGIFVSAKIATKEHEEFAQTMDLIDALPPGLYEAVFHDKDETVEHADLVSGNYLMQFARRGLADIRALGGNDEQDDRRFAAVSRLSDVNQGLYRSFVSPIVKAASTDQSADLLRRLHPHRIRFELFSDNNPWMVPISFMANAVRANRLPAGETNMFLTAQAMASDAIVSLLDGYKDWRDKSVEEFFLDFYGSPFVQAMAGIGADAALPHYRLARDLAREAVEARSAAELEMKIDQGGAVEAGLRALIYVGQGAGEEVVDERVFGALRLLRRSQPAGERLPLSTFKELIRDQYLLLHLDRDRALASIPHMLPKDKAKRIAAYAALRSAIEAVGQVQPGVRARLAEMEELFTSGPDGATGSTSDQALNTSLPRGRIATTRKKTNGGERTVSSDSSRPPASTAGE